MRRMALLLLFAAAIPAAAADKWWDWYERGTTAVNARNYKVAADALQKSIAEMPNEGLNVRAGRSLITYVPHFWLGIAKLNLGDVDGALREWRISEEQGVLARTDYYSRMKDWVARAQTQKQMNAEDAAAGSKKAADAAISRALELQLEALSAGGDRSARYLAAQRKLQDARGQFQRGGTDVSAYKSAEQTAGQAAALFRDAAEDGKQQKAARAAAPAPVRKPAVINVPPALVAKTQTETIAPPTATVITETEVARRIAEQQKKTEAAKASAAVVRPPVAPPAKLDVKPPMTTAVTAVTQPAARPDLRPAYRAFASGDLSASEQMLTRILRSQPAAEAFLLRGCARYTRAMLSRTPDAMLLAATDDFRAALDRKSMLRLDQSAFSPKLVAFFEQVRKKR